MSKARNLVSRGGGGGGGGGSTASISSSRVISSGFCGGGGAIGSATLGIITPLLGASDLLFSTTLFTSSSSLSSIVISSGLATRGGGPKLDGDVVVAVSGAGSCRTRASKRVCRCAANHHVGWRLRRRTISGGDPSCFEVISPRRNGLRRSRPLRSPCCSIPHGQS